MKKNKIYPVYFLFFPLALYILFFLVPSIMGVFYSFTDWHVKAVEETSFIGFDNYIEILTSEKDYSAGIFNTLRFAVISNIIKLIPALLLAVVLHEKMRGKNIYRTFLYLPAVLPYVVVGILFTSILDFSNGLLNNVLELVGLDFLQQKWLTDTNIVWGTILGVDAWKGIGYVMTIFIAGLSTIPKSYYEAAEIDGANFWQRLRHISLPMLSGAITINLVFGITYGLKVFDIIYVLTDGGPGHATEVMTTYAFDLYSLGDYGMATAFNSMLLVITLAVGLIIVTNMSKQEVQQ